VDKSTKNTILRINMKKTDRRIEKTIDAIETAYFELLSEKKNNKITITEIAKRANIDRKTFYLHYTCVDDVIDRYSKTIASKVMETLENNGFFDDGLDVSQFFMTILAVREKEMAKIDALYDLDITALAWKYAESNLKEMISDIAHRFFEKPDLDLKLSVKFYTAGIMNVFASYIRNEIDIDTPELVRILSDLTENGISSKVST